jgi:hypothetical protein
LEEVKLCVQRKDETLRSYIQRWSVIKNSGEDVSDERAIDAFSAGLCRSDLVEEVGRIKPRTVSELMEVANRFADGEDAYNNKRGRSPEVDRTSRQRRRYRNRDSHGRRNQITAGYDRRNEEGYENKEFQSRYNRGTEKPKYSGPTAEDMLYGPCHIHYAYLDGKRVSNHQMKDCRTFLRSTTGRKKHESGIPNATTRKAAGVKSIYISNDPTSAKVQERVEEHIQTGKPGNIITIAVNLDPA